jgi:hypothetical protein
VSIILARQEPLVGFEISGSANLARIAKSPNGNLKNTVKPSSIPTEATSEKTDEKLIPLNFG